MQVPPLLQSKKFLAAALASVISLVGVLYGLTFEQLAMINAPLLAFVGAQAVADIGKSRAQVEAFDRLNDPARRTPPQPDERSEKP